MRYTTVIDISEIPTVYRNHNARLLYIHLCLKAGYHDNDRDIVSLSVRQMSAQSGLTVSAVRHALLVLEKSHLVTRQGTVLYVRKWIAEQSITARPRTARQQAQISAEAQRRKEQEQRDMQLEIERQQRDNLYSQGKNQFMLYYENLQKRAQAGDAEAAELVQRHRKTYENAAKAMNNTK